MNKIGGLTPAVQQKDTVQKILFSRQISAGCDTTKKVSDRYKQEGF